MSSPNTINNNGQKVGAILSSELNQEKLTSNDYRKIAQELLKESEQSFATSKGKEDEARSYFLAADAMDKAAEALRQRAAQMRKGEIDKEKSIDEVKKIVEKHGLVFEFPIPKNASPELLEEIADRLEAKAKENRIKADELLKDAERARDIANKLKEQSELLARKDANLSDIHLKHALAQNEGLSLVLKKLGILKLDSQYKEYVEIAEKKASEQQRLGY